MKTKQLIIFSFIWMGVSCQKDDEFTNCAWSNGTKTQTKASGKILTYGTDDYPGQGQKTLLLLQREVVSSTFLGGSKDVTVDSIYSDINGNYSVSFNAVDPCDFYRIQAVTNYPLHVQKPVIGIEVGRTDKRNIYYSSHAWLKLHVLNSNPQIGDKLAIYWGGGDRDLFFGPFNDTIIKKHPGNGHAKPSIGFYRDGKEYDIKDSFYLPAFDTTYYLLKIDI